MAATGHVECGLARAALVQLLLVLGHMYTAAGTTPARQVEVTLDVL